MFVFLNVVKCRLVFRGRGLNVALDGMRAICHLRVNKRRRMEGSCWTPGGEPQGGMLIDSWLCESRIGQGAYGRVYAVVHGENGLKGALKM